MMEKLIFTGLAILEMLLLLFLFYEVFCGLRYLKEIRNKTQHPKGDTLDKESNHD